jgi:adenine-specific DNA-methyltransferase
MSKWQLIQRCWGKIFESLILQLEEDPESDLRRLTGSYYTPRAIVHFMCQRALKEFLATQLDAQTSEGRSNAVRRVSRLVDFLPAQHIDESQYKNLCNLLSIAEAKLLRGSIFAARVCDPAVGSGAFPVGMLHEMVATVAKLDAIIDGLPTLATHNYDYELKKKVIDSCLYGVDFQEQAVRLCELRLWLSLVVDYELDPKKAFQQAIKGVPALPNLSYRIVRGDSLLERLFGYVVQLDALSNNTKTRTLIQSMQADKQKYFGEGRRDKKRKLELAILSKQAELAEHLVEVKEHSLLQTNLSLFGESTKDRKLREQREQEEQDLAKLRGRIHAAKVALEKLSQQKNPSGDSDSLDQVRRRFFQSGEAPTFLWHVDFAEVFADNAGFDILIGNPPYLFGGNVGIAQEDKAAFRRFYRCGSGKVNLFTLFIERGLSILAHHRPLIYIVPNTLLRVTSYDAIRELVLTKHTISMIVDLGAGMFDDVTMSTIVIAIDSDAPTTDHQIEFRTSLTEEGRLTAQRNYLAPGFVINTSASADDLLLIRVVEKSCVRLGDLCDELIFGVVISGNRDDLVAETPRRGWKPFLEGRDIERYFIRPSQKYLHYVPDEIHRPRTPRIFEAPEKLLIQRITGGARPLAVAYDDEQHYNKESINNLLLKAECPYDIKYVLALLNSTLLSWYYRTSFTNGSTLTVNLSKEYLSQLPFPSLDMTSVTDKQHHDELVKLAEEMLRAGAKSTQQRERIDAQIDQSVYRLYGLSPTEILVVEKR